MDIEDIIEDLINIFLGLFRQESEENKELELTDRIYCNLWKNEILDALHAHDFENFPLTCQNIANWFLRYGEALCEDPMTRNKPGTFKKCNTLRTFPPREILLSALEHKSPRKKLNQICDGKSQSNHKRLNKDNMIENFQLLLEMEDVETLLEYLPLVQYDVELTARSAPDHYGGRITKYFTRKNLAEVVSSKVDEVVIVPKDLTTPFDTTLTSNCIKLLVSNECKNFKLPVANVTEVSEFEVTLKASPYDSWSNPVDLVFRPTRFPLRYQYRSLALLAENEGMRKFLFPERSFQNLQNNNGGHDILMKEKLINKNIAENLEQFTAVCRIANGRITSNSPFIIFGPPGTGKTTTIVESILQLRLQHPGSRILVTAGSNSACDTIALRICEYFKSKRGLEEYFENATALPLLRIYSRSVAERGIQNIPIELRQQSNIEWLNGEHAYPAIEYIHRHGIIVATLSTVGKLVCGNVSATNFFTHVFIDEAGAASEPETLVGIVGIKNDINDHCRIILCGDHKQLGPIIKSDKAVKLGLGKSLMQRLMERDCYAVHKNGYYDQNLQVRLRRNYRSHPEIVELYNKLYYGKELIPMVPPSAVTKPRWSFLRNPNFPIAFHAVYGEMSKSGTSSSCNMLEVQMLISYVFLLLKSESVNQKDIGVITPYKLQSERIKSRLEEKHWYGVEVGSVEYFQGREKPIIIASMVRSKQDLGFVRNRKRLNVLLSRPKVLLLILGEPKTLSNFDDMKRVIELCKTRGNYFDEKNKALGQIKPDPILAERTLQKNKPNAGNTNVKALSEMSPNLNKPEKKMCSSKTKMAMKNADNEITAATAAKISISKLKTNSSIRNSKIGTEIKVLTTTSLASTFKENSLCYSTTPQTKISMEVNLIEIAKTPKNKSKRKEKKKRGKEKPQPLKVGTNEIKTKTMKI